MGVTQLIDILTGHAHREAEAKLAVAVTLLIEYSNTVQGKEVDNACWGHTAAENGLDNGSTKAVQRG